MSGDDDRSWADRDKLSFSERDRLRRDKGKGGGGDRPRGPGARARDAAETKQYLKTIDGMFASGPGGAEGERLAEAMRNARGSPDLAGACRAYRDGVGIPDDASLLSLFLDSGDAELVVAGIEALRVGSKAGGLHLGSGLRTQLRLLAQDPDDAIAEAAEELLDEI